MTLYAILYYGAILFGIVSASGFLAHYIGGPAWTWAVFSYGFMAAFAAVVAARIVQAFSQKKEEK